METDPQTAPRCETEIVTKRVKDSSDFGGMLTTFPNQSGRDLDKQSLQGASDHFVDEFDRTNAIKDLVNVRSIIEEDYQMLHKDQAQFLVHSSFLKLQCKNLLELAHYYKKKLKEVRDSTTLSIEFYDMQIHDLENQIRILRNQNGQIVKEPNVC